MMNKFNYDKIELARRLVGFSIEKLAESIGMTSHGYKKMLKERSLKVSIFETIANVLEQPVTFFFEDDSAGVAGVVGGGVTQIGNIGGVGGNQVLHQNINSDAMKILALERENELLRNAIADKERIINLLTNK